MTTPSKQPISTSPKISKATNVKKVNPIYLELAENLSHIDILQFIKIYNGRLCASNQLSTNKKKQPITEIGKEGIVGVELLVYPDNKTIDFYSVTSSPKGYGRKIVEAVVGAAPDDWTLVVAMDWSSGFWDTMIKDYLRIVIL